MPSYGTPSFSSPTSHENRVDILLDRADNVANVHALQKLARLCPTVVTVAVTPGGGLGAPELLWALGKRRSTRWKDPSPSLHDAEVWLKANQIRELIVLQAQHLPDGAADQLRKWAGSVDLDIALLHCGAGLNIQASVTIEAFLDQPRRPAIPEGVRSPWPQIEEVNLLDYRTQCFCQLSDAEYLRVDRAFHGAATRIGWFFSALSRASREDLGIAIALATATDDEQLREILMNGALIGLLRSGRALPEMPPTLPPFEPHPIPRAQVHEFLEDINPQRAAVRFLRHWTRLSDRRLSVIGPEQITTTTVAGIEIPPVMQPTFRAAIGGTDDDHSWSPFDGGVWVSTQRWKVPETDPPIDEANEPRSRATYSDRPEIVAEILSQALTLGAHWAISRKRIPPASRQDIEHLHERGLLYEVYPGEHEITEKAVHDSSTVSDRHPDVGAAPEEILLFLLKHGSQYELPKYRDATTKEERKHSRLVRLLANLVAYGHLTRSGLSGYLAEAIQSLKQSGYIANFGPFGYRLSERGVYSLCWDEGLTGYRKRPSDYDPPPLRTITSKTPSGVGQGATEKPAIKRRFL